MNIKSDNDAYVKIENLIQKHKDEIIRLRSEEIIKALRLDAKKANKAIRGAGVSANKKDNIASPAALKAMYEKLKAEYHGNT